MPLELFHLNGLITGKYIRAVFYAIKLFREGLILSNEIDGLEGERLAILRVQKQISQKTSKVIFHMVGTGFNSRHYCITDRKNKGVSLNVRKPTNPFVRRRKVVFFNFWYIKEVTTNTFDSINGLIEKVSIT